MITKYPDRYWLQVDRATYPYLESILRQATRVTSELRGPTGTDTYRLDPRLNVTALDDDTLAVGSGVLSAELTHLPTHAYRALVTQSPGFRQYAGLNALYGEMRRGQPMDPAALTRRLNEIIAAGRQIMPEPSLVVMPSTFQATWWPQETYLRRREGKKRTQGKDKDEWFLCLTFEAAYVPSGVVRPRSPIGLDLGLNPLTVSFSADAEVQVFKPTPLDHLRRDWGTPVLSARATRLLKNLTYASGRQDAERVIAHLTHRASRVFAEVIRLEDMSPWFVGAARCRAIHDHHFSALSQYLYAAGIPFRRVSSGYTSQECPTCRDPFGQAIRGRRQGDTFVCPACGTVENVHVIAAQNVLIRGEASWVEKHA